MTSGETAGISRNPSALDALRARTDALIEEIANQRLEPAPFRPIFVLTAATGAALVSAVLLTALWLKLRPGLSLDFSAQNAIPALKMIFTVAIAAAALLLLRDLSVPGRQAGRRALFVAIPFIAIAGVALIEIALFGWHRPGAHLGHGSWLECLWEIPALGVPAFVLLVITVRHLAPTRLSAAGGVLGLLAGAVGATGYAFHCSDDSMVFVAAAYSAAIAETTVLGALLGPRLLRWS